MTIAHRLLLTATILSVLSCTERGDNFVIGVSQCSEDSWRKKLKEELEMATYFNEGVTLLFASANDDSQLQQRQIDSLAASLYFIFVQSAVLQVLTFFTFKISK